MLVATELPIAPLPVTVIRSPAMNIAGVKECFSAIMTSSAAAHPAIADGYKSRATGP
jgi:hypothetical protein